MSVVPQKYFDKTQGKYSESGEGCSFISPSNIEYAGILAPVETGVLRLILDRLLGSLYKPPFLFSRVGTIMNRSFIREFDP